MHKLLSQLHIDVNDLPNKNIFIGNDLLLFTHTTERERRYDPIKLDKAMIIVCSAGHLRAKINLNEYDVESPMVITLMPGQIFEPVEYSPNFKAYSVALSKRFVEALNIPGWQQKYLDMYNNPISVLDQSELKILLTFFAILYYTAEDEQNPFRLQVIENLTRVFYYGGLGQKHYVKNNGVQIKNSIVERFIELVHTHYREERLISYYADMLCITPKYLSKLVKENTGRSAGEWIESHVILEARAMLQSSDLTIQQIASSLNFANQSFFGKYFKRATGLSPKQYRHSKHNPTSATTR